MDKLYLLLDTPDPGLTLSQKEVWRCVLYACTSLMTLQLDYLTDTCNCLGSRFVVIWCPHSYYNTCITLHVKIKLCVKRVRY